jgi:ferredoxin
MFFLVIKFLLILRDFFVIVIKFRYNIKKEIIMVVITDLCINCSACIDECPVEAIVDEDDNPTGEDIYFVYKDKCVECVGYYDSPACAEACPTEGCIIWGPKSDRPQQEKRGEDGDACIDS